MTTSAAPVSFSLNACITEIVHITLFAFNSHSFRGTVVAHGPMLSPCLAAAALGLNVAWGPLLHAIPCLFPHFSLSVSIKGKMPQKNLQNEKQLQLPESYIIYILED